MKKLQIAYPIIVEGKYDRIKLLEVCEGLIEILKKYEIKRVFYGHIHGNYTVAPKNVFEEIEFNIISADYLGFIPKCITKN